MKTYQYTGFDRAGGKCRGFVEASSPKEARDRLLGDGILADRLDAAGPSKGLSADESGTIYHELSALLAAGLPLVKAFELMIQAPELANVRPILSAVRDKVRDGSSLAAAMKAANPSITEFETAIIEAAERSATVDVMLAQLAGFLEEQDRLKGKVQAALFYPAIIFGGGICVAILMMGLLVPKAAEILGQSGAPMPFITRAVIATAGVVARWGWIPAAAIVVGVFMARKRLAGDPSFRLGMDRRIFALPLVGTGYALLANVRFTRTLAVLMNGGVSVMDAFILAGRATGSPWIRSLAEAGAEEIRHGSSMSDALRKIPPLAGSLPGWVQVGEASGGLPGMLEKCGARFQAAWDKFVTGVLNLLPVVLIVLIGAFVMIIALAVLMPIISMSQAIGQ